MRLSLQVRYAIAGMFDIAYNGGGEPVQVRVIGERQAIPARYLEQIFQRLRRAGLVRGKRGPGGGYVLSRAAARVSLLDVVEAIEGGAPTEGEKGEEGDAAAASGGGAAESGLAFLWPEVEREFEAVLARRSLEDVCRDAARAGVPRSDAERYVYEI